ncbi:cbb3-type cytochrome oxidase assembly protein CcoS [Halomonas litopenaei]|uniref:cbb3-type cytochrome oxidase assembly protein CcoS n=1 Tax=Halomonas litopenaei TaxID=2109328 RepID=UPI003F9FC427
MSILYLLIPLSLILLGLAVWAFFWAVRNDQFEDLEGPAYRILFEDEDDTRSADDGASSCETPADPCDRDPTSRGP